MRERSGLRPVSNSPGRRASRWTAAVLAALLVMARPGSGTGAPAIEAAAGRLAHGSFILINGSGFGRKEPAPPLVWDDGASAPPLSEHYDAFLPVAAQQGSLFNMAYRAPGFRAAGTPHGRIRFVLGGAHATDSAFGQYGSGGVVGLGKNMTSPSFFASYYYRVDPSFDEHDNPALGENMKELVLSSEEGQFYPDGWGAFGYLGWCGSSVPDVNYRGEVRLSRIPIDPARRSLPYGCSGDNLVHHASPLNGWVKVEWEGSYNDRFDAPQITLATYPDGRRTRLSHYGDGLTLAEYSRGPWSGYPKKKSVRFIGLGGFARVPRMQDGVNSFRYFAGVYIDGSRARVMLGDSPDYGACKLMEPQIPVSWTASSIRAKVNLGGFPECGTAYLFVFDASGSRNEFGFPVTIGGGGDGAAE